MEQKRRQTGWYTDVQVDESNASIPIELSSKQIPLLHKCRINYNHQWFYRIVFDLGGDDMDYWDDTCNEIVVSFRSLM